MKIEDHDYKLFWSEEDGEWVAETDCCSLLSWLAPTPLEALEGLLKIIPEEEETS